MSGWMQHLIAVPILLPLAVSGILLAFDERRRTVKRVVSLTTVAVLVVVAVMLLWLVSDGFSLNPAAPPRVYLLGNWPAPFGIVLVVDSPACWALPRCSMPWRGGIDPAHASTCCSCC